MTVLTKTSDLLKKPEIIDTPLVAGAARYDVEQLNSDMRPRTRVLVYRSKCSSAMLAISFVTTLLMLLGAVLALIYFSDNKVYVPTRYRGYCTIPLDIKESPTAYRVPLRWSPQPQMTAFANKADHDAANAILNSLMERFEIDDNVEKISVVNSGQNVEFIHDFNINATAIVDSQRCFVMDLDPEAVLSPGVFMLHIENGEDFDVMRVKRRVRALVPTALSSLRQLSAVLAEHCGDRPAYHLETYQSDIIRKRSVDDPKQDYLHFAGKHLLEISIDNMGELLEYEKTHA